MNYWNIINPSKGCSPYSNSYAVQWQMIDESFFSDPGMPKKDVKLH